MLRRRSTHQAPRTHDRGPRMARGSTRIAAASGPGTRSVARTRPYPAHWSRVRRARDHPCRTAPPHLPFSASAEGLGSCHAVRVELEADCPNGPHRPVQPDRPTGHRRRADLDDRRVDHAAAPPALTFARPPAVRADRIDAPTLRRSPSRQLPTPPPLPADHWFRQRLTAPISLLTAPERLQNGTGAFRNNIAADPRCQTRVMNSAVRPTPASTR